MEVFTMTINFDRLPEPNTTPEPKVQFKQWDLSNIPSFDRAAIKLHKFGKNQRRLIFPKHIVDQLKINAEFKAHFVIYRALNKIKLILSKTTYDDADFIRKISPIGVGLYYTVIPAKLIKAIPNFPEVVWLQNTLQSTDEDIVLEIYPG